MSPGVGIGKSPIFSKKRIYSPYIPIPTTTELMTTTEFITTTVDPFYAIINDGDTVFFYDPTDLTTITKDGSNFISRWNDKLGSGHNLLQADGAKQPLWVSPGTVRFDGVNDFMKAAAFTWNAPSFIYAIIKQITHGGDVIIFCGNGNIPYLRQDDPSPKLRLYNGSSIDNAGLAVGVWGVVRVLINGADSKIIIDNNVPVTGNIGTLDGMGGFTLAARSVGTLCSNIEVEAIIGRKSAVGEADIYNYMVSRKP